MDAVRVTEAAAIAAWALAGRGDEKAADQAAVDAMRTALNALAIDGVIVIGEGERDEAPMLYIGEKVGRARRPAHRHRARSAGRHHADRQGHGQRAGGDGLGAGRHPAQRPRHLHGQDRLRAGLSRRRDRSRPQRRPTTSGPWPTAKGVDPREITVCVLDRPRHAEIIASLREAGARVHLITDGDVAGVINTADPDTGVDIYVGQGGAPEGVLACAALKCVGGQFQGRLVFRNADERARADAARDHRPRPQVRPARDGPRRRHLRRHRRHRRAPCWTGCGSPAASSTPTAW